MRITDWIDAGGLLRRLAAPPACGSCRFWREGGQGGGAGECRREGPRVITYADPAAPVLMHGRRNGAQPATVNVQSYWPPAHAGAWCGQWRRRWT